MPSPRDYVEAVEPGLSWPLLMLHIWVILSMSNLGSDTTADQRRETTHIEGKSLSRDWWSF